MLLLFGMVMLSALLPILRPLPMTEAVSPTDMQQEPRDSATSVAKIAPSDGPPPASTGAALDGKDDAAAEKTVAEDRPAGKAAKQAGEQAGAVDKRASSDRSRQIASLPPVPGSGAPPAAPPDARAARPDVAVGALSGPSVPEPLAGQAGAAGLAAREREVGPLPGTREAARPPAPRRDADLPARPVPEQPDPAPSAAAGQGPLTEAETDTTGARGSSGTGRDAFATGLPVPETDAAPDTRISTVPPVRPETGAGVADVANPQADAAPQAPAASTTGASAPTGAVPPPAVPRAPNADPAPAAPGLPGRTLQRTPIRPGAAPEVGDVAPRIGRVDAGPPVGPNSAAPLPGPGAVAALPEVGAPATGRARPASDPNTVPETPETDDETAPEHSADEVGDQKTAREPQTADRRAALPRVRRPGVDNGRERDGPAFGGPSAPADPAIEERALPVPGFSSLRSGVRTGRLPQIGDDRPDAADGEDAADTPAETTPGADAGALAGFDPDIPLGYNAEPFVNAEGRPVFSVIVLDDTGDAAGRDRLAALDLPLTVALDPTTPGAAKAAERYRAAGKEVLILASALPDGATAVDVEVSLAGMFAAIPSAVGLIDMAEGGFQNDRITARHVVQVLGAEGYGLLTHDRGLNAAAQLAEQADLAVGRVFRVLDAEGESEETIRRYLDRAAFRAGQQGTVIVMGHNRPETIAALIGWAMEGRARGVALAPVTAALIR